MADMSGQMPIPTPKKLQVFKELKAIGLPYQTISGLMGNIDVETGGTFDYKQKQNKERIFEEQRWGQARRPWGSKSTR